MIFHASKKKGGVEKIQSYPRFLSRRFPLNSCDERGFWQLRLLVRPILSAFVYLYAHSDSAKQQRLNAPRETVGIVEKNPSGVNCGGRGRSASYATHPHLAAPKVSPPIETQAATRRDSTLFYWEERNYTGNQIRTHRRVRAHKALKYVKYTAAATSYGVHARYCPTGVCFSVCLIRVFFLCVFYL